MTVCLTQTPVPCFRLTCRKVVLLLVFNPVRTVGAVCWRDNKEDCCLQPRIGS